jgi:hypothetical protein
VLISSYLRHSPLTTWSLQVVAVVVAEVQVEVVAVQVDTAQAPIRLQLQPTTP